MTDPMVLADVGRAFHDTVISGPILLAIGACLITGLVSFASPCVIPLVPGYLSYLAGLVGAEAPAVSADESPKRGRLRVLGAAAMFVLGFTVVYLMASAAVFGMKDFFLDESRLLWLQRIGGVVTVIMGLVFLGMLPIFQREFRFSPVRVSNWIGAPLLGAAFAVGWIPCMGATLSAIVTVSLSTEGVDVVRGIIFVTAYCFGLGIPFLILAFSSAWAVRSMGFLRRHARAIQLIGGVLLIIVGFLMVTGAWNEFVSWVRMRFVSDMELPI